MRNINEHALVATFDVHQSEENQMIYEHDQIFSFHEATKCVKVYVCGCVDVHVELCDGLKNHGLSSSISSFYCEC